MRSAAWISLLRIVPPELSNKLVCVMSNGNEINIADICRIEEEFVVVRGRLAGTTDEATIIFVPLEGIGYLGFRIPMKDAEVAALFETWGAPAAEMEYQPMPAAAASVAKVAPAAAATPAPAPAAAPGAPPPTPAPPPVPTAPPAAAPAAAGSISQILPGKAALLERLRRSRLNQESPKSSEGR